MRAGGGGHFKSWGTQAASTAWTGSSAVMPLGPYVRHLPAELPESSTRRRCDTPGAPRGLSLVA